MDSIGRRLSSEEQSVLIVLAQEGRSGSDRTSIAVAMALERDVIDVAGVLQDLERGGLVERRLDAMDQDVWAATTDEP